MAEVTGSFERGILESSRVLAVQGQVLPSTLQPVTLMGELRLEPVGVSRVSGESSIAEAAGSIERVYLEPGDASAYPGAVHAILNADLIVAGPGSLYTSVLPNLLIKDIAKAIEASRASKAYVCNVATQRGETEGYTAAEHVAALEKHVGGGLFQTVVVNDNQDVEFEGGEGVELVQPSFPPDINLDIINADLADAACPWRHDSEKLSQVLLDLI